MQLRALGAAAKIDGIDRGVIEEARKAVQNPFASLIGRASPRVKEDNKPQQETKVEREMPITGEVTAARAIHNLQQQPGQIAEKGPNHEARMHEASQEVQLANITGKPAKRGEVTASDIAIAEQATRSDGVRQDLQEFWRDPTGLTGKMEVADAGPNGAPDAPAVAPADPGMIAAQHEAARNPEVQQG